MGKTSKLFVKLTTLLFIFMSSQLKTKMCTQTTYITFNHYLESWRFTTIRTLETFIDGWSIVKNSLNWFTTNNQRQHATKKRCALDQRKTFHLLQFAKNIYNTQQRRWCTMKNKENDAPTTTKKWCELQQKKQHTYSKEDDMLVAKKMTCLQQRKQRTSKKIMCIATKTTMCMEQRRQCATKMMRIASKKNWNENN